MVHKSDTFWKKSPDFLTVKNRVRINPVFNNEEVKFQNNSD